MTQDRKHSTAFDFVATLVSVFLVGPLLGVALVPILESFF